jgi:hypothetical protein
MQDQHDVSSRLDARDEVAQAVAKDKTAARAAVPGVCVRHPVGWVAHLKSQGSSASVFRERPGHTTDQNVAEAVAKTNPAKPIRATGVNRRGSPATVLCHNGPYSSEKAAIFA